MPKRTASSEPEQQAAAEPATEKAPKPTADFAELVALKKLHPGTEMAFLRYAGNATRTLEEWAYLYEEFMKKPSNVSKADWKLQFAKLKGKK